MRRGTVLHLKLINTQVALGPGHGEVRGCLRVLPPVFRAWEGCLVAGRTGSRALSRPQPSRTILQHSPFPTPVHSSAREVAEPRLQLCLLLWASILALVMETQTCCVRGLPGTQKAQRSVGPSQPIPQLDTLYQGLLASCLPSHLLPSPAH